MNKICYIFVLLSILAIDPINSTEPRETSWEEYLQNTANESEPRQTLLLALQYFEKENTPPGNAADLGAGTGRDTLFLLKSGWHVLALDAEQLAIDIIMNRVDPAHLSRLQVQVVPFSKMALPKELDLINASFSLPFCEPKDFDQLWETVVDSLRAGGRFCGQFFGVEGEWYNLPHLTIHSDEEIKRLFHSRFEIEYLKVIKSTSPNTAGLVKQWHTYHVIAKKLK